QHRRPFAIALTLTRLNRASSKGEFGAICGERIRRQFIDGGSTWSNRNTDILSSTQGHMSQFLFTTLARMDTVEIEGKQVEKLELLVVLEQVIFLDPPGRFRILHDLILKLLLPIDFPGEHPVGQRSILRRNLVNQDQVRQSVAPIV